MSNIIFIGDGGIGPGGDIMTITGNTGGAVPPTGNNVNLLGGLPAGLTVAGDIGSSTLTINKRQLTAATADATPTAIFTHAMTNLSAVTFNYTVSAARDDYTASFWATGTVGFRRAGGGALKVEIQGQFSGDDDLVGNNPSVLFDPSGNNAILYVIGVAATNWIWTAEVSYVVR